MQNTEQLAKEIILRAEKLKKKRAKKLYYISVASSSAVSLCIMLFAIYIVPEVMQNKFSSSSTTTLSASIFTNPQFLSYIIIGILAFFLGIISTVLCIYVKKRGE